MRLFYSIRNIGGCPSCMRTSLLISGALGVASVFSLFTLENSPIENITAYLIFLTTLCSVILTAAHFLMFGLRQARIKVKLDSLSYSSTVDSGRRLALKGFAGAVGAGMVTGLILTMFPNRSVAQDRAVDIGPTGPDANNCPNGSRCSPGSTCCYHYPSDSYFCCPEGTRCYGGNTTARSVKHCR